MRLLKRGIRTRFTFTYNWPVYFFLHHPNIFGLVSERKNLQKTHLADYRTKRKSLKMLQAQQLHKFGLKFFDVGKGDDGDYRGSNFPGLRTM